jgi:hypothetical protein
MKRSWLILLGGLAVGLIGYTWIYLRATSLPLLMEQSSCPELAWFKSEYRLTDAQFAAITRLHEAYRPHCAEMCRRIDEQNAKVQQLLAAANVVTPEIKQALAEAARLRAECQSAMLQHYYETSRQMPQEQAERYLAWVQRETLTPSQMLPTRPTMKME